MTISLLVLAAVFMAAGLAVQIGVASWNIRRADRYRKQKDAAEKQAASSKELADHIAEKFHGLDKYATNISWLLKFLFDRYNKFTDIEKELTEDKPDGVEDNYKKDLERAVKLIKITVRASDKVEGLITSVAAQIHGIMRDMDSLEDGEAGAENQNSPDRT